MNGRRQRGVALLTVLLLLAVAVAACTALMVGQQRQILSQVDQASHRQAWQWALEVEARSLQALSEAASHRVMPVVVLPPPPEHTQWQGQLVDLSGRLNLNALVSGPGQLDSQAYARFQRLLQLLQLPSALARTVIARIDPAAVPAGPAVPPLPVHGALADSSELRTLPGFDAAVWATLEPHVTALPAGIGLNLNQASAPVLASLADGLGQAGGQRLRAARPPGGWASVAAFTGQPALARQVIASQGLAVEGRAYQIHSRIRHADTPLLLVSQVLADRGRWRVISRQVQPVIAVEEQQ